MNDTHGTPALVIDLGVVAGAYRTLAAGLPGVALYYAVKCNAARPVLATLYEHGCGFEIASAAFRYSMPAARLHASQK